MSLPVQIKVLDGNIGSMMEFPQYQTGMSAGLDLVACIEKPITIVPGEKATLIPTGIAVYIADPNYAAVILPRSGLGHKQGLVLGNGTGLIDADYQGQLFVSAWNRNPSLILEEEELVIAPDPSIEDEWTADVRHNENQIITVNPGDRIAQLVFLPIARARFEVVTDFHEVSQRGEGGFGSTGVAVSAP